jgi:adenine/guanine phosphoribosyltransferase-like PRPP-binding protein
MRIISEPEFVAALRDTLDGHSLVPAVGAVTGPGRSGAIAAVYASHYLGVPFIPYGQKHPRHLGRLLIIDTAAESGATLRKAARRYEGDTPFVLAIYHEPPRVTFWYEAPKPQRYRHELRRAA